MSTSFGTASSVSASDAGSLLNSSDPHHIVLGLKSLALHLRRELLQEPSLDEADSLMLAGSSSKSSKSGPLRGDGGVDDEGQDEDCGYDSSSSSSSSASSSSSSSSSARGRKNYEEDWKADTANYNVPFVGTKIFSSKKPGTCLSSAAGAAEKSKGEWTLADFIAISPNLHELFGPDLFSNSNLHTKTLSKTKSQRRLSADIVRRHTDVLSLVCLVAHHSSTLPEGAAVKVGQLVKKTLLKGMMFKHLIQLAAGAPAKDSSSSENSSSSNRRLQVSALNLFSAMIALFSTNLCGSLPPYNVLSEVVTRMELGCSIAGNKGRHYSSYRDAGGGGSGGLQKSTALQLTGSWLFRPEPKLIYETKKARSTYLTHSVCLAALSLTLRILKTLHASSSSAASTAGAIKHNLRGVLLSYSASSATHRGTRKGFVSTALLKAFLLPKVICKMSSRDGTEASETNQDIVNRYFKLTGGICDVLRDTLATILQSPSPAIISNREITDFLLPRDALSTIQHAGIAYGGASAAQDAPPPASRLSDIEQMSHSFFKLLLLMLSPSSPYFGTIYNIRNVARTLTLIPGQKSDFLASQVKSVLTHNDQTAAFFVKYFKIGDFGGGQSDSSGGNDNGGLDDLDININDGGSNDNGNKGRARAKAKKANADMSEAISIYSYLTSILNLPVDPKIPPEDCATAISLLPYFLPPPLNKKVVSKMVTHPDTLLVHTTLDLVASILSRCSRSSILRGSPQRGDFCALMRNRMPDLQCILSLKSKYDSFASSLPDAKKDNVTYSFLEVISLYHQHLVLDEQSSMDIKYDFTKLLPASSDIAFSKPEALREMLLSTLYAVSAKREGIVWSGTSLKVLLTIIVRAPSGSGTDKLAKKLVRKILCPTLGEALDLDFSLEHYAASCLIENMLEEHVLPLSSAIDDLKKNKIQYKMVPAAAGVSANNFPPFLAALFSYCRSASSNDDEHRNFSNFVSAILLESIKFSPNAKAFCTVLKYMLRDQPAETPLLQVVVSLAVDEHLSSELSSFTSEANSHLAATPSHFKLVQQVRELLFAFRYTAEHGEKDVFVKVANIFRSSGGNPHFGQAAKIFFGKFVAPQDGSNVPIFSDIMLTCFANLDDLSDQQELLHAVEITFFCPITSWLKEVGKGGRAHTCHPLPKDELEFLEISSSIVECIPNEFEPKTKLFHALIEECRLNGGVGWKQDFLYNLASKGAHADVGCAAVKTVMEILINAEGRNAKEKEQLGNFIARVTERMDAMIDYDGCNFKIGTFVETALKENLEGMLIVLVKDNVKAYASLLMDRADTLSDEMLAVVVSDRISGIVSLSQCEDILRTRFKVVDKGGGRAIRIFGASPAQVSIIQAIPGILAGRKGNAKAATRLAQYLTEALLHGLHGRGKAKPSGGATTSEIGLMLAAKATVEGQLELSELEKRLLQSAVVLRVFSILPRACRKKGVGEHGPRMLVDAFQALLQEEASERFDLEVMRKNLPVLSGLILTLLKYAVTVSEEGGEENGIGDSGYLLHFLRKMMKVFSPVSLLHDGEHVFDPKRILLLLLSHSSFDRAMEKPSALKVEILKTCELCLTVTSKQEKTIEQGDLEALFVSILKNYNAGMSRDDAFARRIFFLLESKFDFQKNMDEMRWKGVETRGKDAGIGSFGWFFTAIEERRVKATMGNFPLNDALIPDFWEDSMEEGSVEGSGGGEDLRYSPAFLVPLILSCVEYFLPGEIPEGYQEEDDDEDQNGFGRGSHYGRYSRRMDVVEREEGGQVRDEETERKIQRYISAREKFVALARRLCDNGAVAMAIASLCSKDLKIRKFSVVLLSMLFRYGLESKAAVKVLGWSARPQLSLVVESLLKGLDWKMSLVDNEDAADSDGGGGREEDSNNDAFYVPKLPGTTALFLAQSFLIMSKPSDPLYSQVNAFYLKQDRGTFKDLNALPAFGQLYCSATATHRTERMWAMKLLADGTLSNHDFQVASRRFAPSLIMTSLESANADSEEKRLCLRVLEVMLDRGGKGAAKALLGQCGLLSWLEVVGRRNWSADWGVGVKLKYLDLVSLSLKKARSLEEEEEEEEEDAREEDKEEGNGAMWPCGASLTSIETSGLYSLLLKFATECGENEEERVTKLLLSFDAANVMERKRSRIGDAAPVVERMNKRHKTSF